MAFIMFLIVGGVAGCLAGMLLKGRGFGLIGNIIVGVLGGFLGGWLFGKLNISIGTGLVNEIVTSLAGAVVLLFVVSFIKKK